MSNTQRHQVFAAGRWQDITDGGTVEVANEDELKAAQEGRLDTRLITVTEKRSPRIALCLSTPRVGFLRPFHMLLMLANQFGVSVFSGDGVFWHHALSRSIKNACDFYFEDTGDDFDFILTADYDTYALPQDLIDLATLLGRSPEADCLVTMQSKRGGTGEILAGGREMNMLHEIVPIETAHFGFTLFRKEFFARLRKPWFYEKPDINGDWGEGRIDADIGFWENARKCGLRTYLATQIVVGHGEELVTYPRIQNGQIDKVYQSVNGWLNTRTKPVEIGVIQGAKNASSEQVSVQANEGCGAGNAESSGLVEGAGSGVRSRTVAQEAA